MDPQEIRELIELISKTSFTTFELEREGFRLRLVRDPAAAPQSAPGASTAISAPTTSVTAAPHPPPDAPPQPAPGLVELDSPIVGTFFRSPAPDAPPFVEVGDRIARGQVVCIVEAMKVMNEIEAEIDAEVVEVVVSNGQPVEYGETLFRLRPL